MATQGGLQTEKYFIVKENKYRLNSYRLLMLWALPAFFLVFILFLFIAKFGNVSAVPAAGVIPFVLLLLFCVGSFVFLFFNHLPAARGTELIIGGKKLTIARNGIADVIAFPEISNITSYRASSKVPWGFIMYWHITAKEKQYLISSLTISQSSFERYFYDKIKEEKNVIFPTITRSRQ